MKLTAAELLYILECIRRVQGPGYAPGKVGQLQVKLSLMLDVAGSYLPSDVIPLPPEKQ